MSSSFPVFSTPVEEKYPKLPDLFHTSSERELMRNSVSQQAFSLSPDGSTVGHLFSSSSRFHNEMHVSSVSPQVRKLQSSPFISQSRRDEEISPPISSSHSEVQSTALINHSEENKDVTWSIDPLPDFLDFPETVTVQNGQLESSTGVIASEDHAKRTDWQEWADQLISVDDDLEPNWSELLNDANITDSKQKVCSSMEYGFCAYAVSLTVHVVLLGV